MHISNTYKKWVQMLPPLLEMKKERSVLTFVPLSPPPVKREKELKKHWLRQGSITLFFSFIILFWILFMIITLFLIWLCRILGFHTEWLIESSVRISGKQVKFFEVLFVKYDLFVVQKIIQPYLFSQLMETFCILIFHWNKATWVFL